jgi:hypothetical protein
MCAIYELARLWTATLLSQQNTGSLVVVSGTEAGGKIGRRRRRAAQQQRPDSRCTAEHTVLQPEVLLGREVAALSRRAAVLPRMFPAPVRPGHKRIGADRRVTMRAGRS